MDRETQVGGGTTARTSSARRVRAGLALSLVLGLVLAGCGGSGNSGRSDTTSGQLGPVTGVSGLKGASQFDGKAGQQRFQALANTICQTVRSGAPAPLQEPVKQAALRKYAASASRANQRVIVSLQRLGAPDSLREPLERLLGALKQLQPTYAAASSGHGAAAAKSLAREISMTETRAGSAALASGVPACAPHPPGMGSVSGINSPSKDSSAPSRAKPSNGKK